METSEVWPLKEGNKHHSNLIPSTKFNKSSRDIQVKHLSSLETSLIRLRKQSNTSQKWLKAVRKKGPFTFELKEKPLAWNKLAGKIWLSKACSWVIKLFQTLCSKKQIIKYEKTHNEEKSIEYINKNTEISKEKIYANIWLAMLRDRTFYPRCDGVTIKMPYGVDVLHRPARTASLHLFLLD